MFQYNSVHIINSALDPNGTLARYSGDAHVFNVTRVNTFKKENIDFATQTSYTASVNEVATLTIPTVSTSTYDTLTLDLYVGLVDNTDSSYGMSYNKFEKPFNIQIIHTGTPATDAQHFVDVFNKMKIRMDYGPITATCSGAVITFTAKTQFQRFTRCYLKAQKPLDTSYMATQTEDDVTGSGFTVTTHGVVGFGDDQFMIRSVKSPTLANNDPFGLGVDARAVPGGNYSCFIIGYHVRRDFDEGIGGYGGNNVVTHYFYVISSLAAAFKAELIKTYPELETNDATLTNDLVETVDDVVATTASIAIGATKTVGAETTNTLTFSTSDATKATVNSYGEVTGVAAGTATITITDTEANSYGTVLVTVA
jgi:hypothetical protein